MPLDDSTDVPLAALAALVRAALPVEIGADVLFSVYEDPRDLLTQAGTKLPSLAVYRVSEQRVRLNSTTVVERVLVAFDYVLPSTGVDRRGGRWPILQRVWNEIVDIVFAGHHAAVSDDAAVLEAAGVTVDEDSAKASYGFADHGGQSYPMARGRIELDFDHDAVDPTTLDKFLSLHASYDLVQTDDTADTPSQPGVSTDEGPVETDLPDFDIADL